MWLRNEDAAVKAKFAALSVTDENAPSGAPRPVAVRFRLPETELANLTFPYILIDQADLQKASEREHRGPTTLGYIPEEFAATPANHTYFDEDGVVQQWVPGEDPLHKSPFKAKDHPIPYDIDYTITVVTRNQSHMTQLVRALSKIDRIPHRFGYIEVPEDGTVRSLDVLGGPEIQSEKDGDGKRMFRAVYSIRVPSEIDLYETELVSAKYVETVDLGVEVLDGIEN